MNNKRVFLYVHGGDYSALEFENYNSQEVYEEMIADGIATKTIETDEAYMEIEIIEFGAIDDKFIDFVKDSLCDYDQLKDADIFEVKPLN